MSIVQATKITKPLLFLINMSDCCCFTSDRFSLMSSPLPSRNAFYQETHSQNCLSLLLASNQSKILAPQISCSQPESPQSFQIHSCDDRGSPGRGLPATPATQPDSRGQQLWSQRDGDPTHLDTISPSSLHYFVNLYFHCFPFIASIAGQNESLRQGLWKGRILGAPARSLPRRRSPCWIRLS